MKKRIPGMYAFYKTEVNHALDTGDHERVGFLISDMPYDILVELRREGLLPFRTDSDGTESVENSRKRTYKVEQDWTLTYTRVLEFTIDSTGDEQADQDKVENMVDTPCFPTEFENGVVIEDVKACIDIYPVELPEDRVYLNPEDQAIVEKTMAKLQPNQ